MEKNPGYIILLHLCTINEDHMMYGSWDVVAQRTEFFVILRHFLPFDPHLTTRKIKILKNENKRPVILSFHTCVPQITIIWCMVPEIWSAKDRIFSHFGLMFGTDRQRDRWTDGRKNGWTDGRTDGRKKWHIGGCHLKNLQLNHSCKGFELATDHSCQLKKLILVQAFFIALVITNF